jgi:hypothetical protein
VENPPNRTTPVTLAVLASFMVLISVFVAAEGAVRAALGLGGIALMTLGGCVLYMLFQTTEYVVLLSSAAGEVEAFTSYDRQEVRDIVRALNEAIIDMGG